MSLFQEGNTVSNNKLIFPVALKKNVCVMCNFPFDQRANILKKSFSNWVEVNIFL
jgi:hypothetical protein